MLTHAIVQGGCPDTVRESALKTDSGRGNKSFSAQKTRICVTLLRLAFRSKIYQLSHPASYTWVLKHQEPERNVNIDYHYCCKLQLQEICCDLQNILQ